MRWADLDLLGHVNNVTYVDYLQEARVDMMRALGQRRESHDDLEDGVVVVRHEVTYLAPLELRFEPVSIECWVTEVRAASFTLAYEVYVEDASGDGGRHVHLRATTLLTPYVFAEERPRRLTAAESAALAPYVEPAPARPTERIGAVDRAASSHYPLQVRFSDVDLYRHVNNVKYFEYFQEARIRLMADLVRGRDVGMASVVVAQTDVDYLRPILLREAPYDVWSRVSRVGTRSMTIEGEVVDDAGETPETLARSRVTVVFWDPVTQRSAEPPAELRELLG